ncbi:MAG: hypothetical protein H6R07_3178 [Proteobacteria bacterium]|nr:hypothetical protein [Pseudomonadota bacterium]
MPRIFFNWPRTARHLALLVTTLACGCTSAEPKMVGGMTGEVYNYSKEGFALVKLNGKTVGTATKKAKIGEVTSGGGICCVSMPLGAATATVLLDPSKGEPVTVTATVEKWWPDLASSAIVHILPGRKVVVSIGPNTWPRKDLLDARIKELGLTSEYNDPNDPWTLGPLERTDGVK